MSILEYLQRKDDACRHTRVKEITRKKVCRLPASYEKILTWKIYYADYF